MSSYIEPTLLRVKLTILKGSNLVPRDKNAQGDPYVTVKLGSAVLYRTHACNGTLNPVWNGATATIGRIASDVLGDVLIEVWDRDMLGQDRFMGNCALPLPKSFSTPFPESVQWLRLTGVPTGQLLIGLELTPVRVKMEGHLQKRGHALVLKKRYLVLFEAPEPSLGFYNDENCCNARSVVSLTSKNNRIEESSCDSRGPAMFLLHLPPAHDRIFRCANNDVSYDWIEAINEFMKEAKKAVADSLGVGLSSIHSSITGAAAAQFRTTSSQTISSPKKRNLFFTLRNHTHAAKQVRPNSEQIRSAPKSLGSMKPKEDTISSKTGPKHPFFGVSIEDLVARGDFGPDKKTLPPVIAYLFKDIRERGMDVEGIFRVSGSHGCVTGARSRLEETGSVDGMIRSDDLPHVTASLIKLFFRSLPEPVIPFAMYQECVDTVQQTDESCVLKGFKEMIEMRLPIPNKTLLSNLMWLLEEIVSDHVASTQMSASNFGIVFGPSLMWTKDQDALTLLRDTNAITAVVEFFIENCEALFGPARTKIVSHMTCVTASCSSDLISVGSNQSLPQVSAQSSSSSLTGSSISSSLTSTRRSVLFLTESERRRREIDYDKVFAAVDSETPEAIAEQAQRLFRAYDFDGTERLNLDEFVAFFIDLIQHAHLNSFSRDDIRLLMETVSEGDMLITLDQFLVWWSDVSFSLNSNSGEPKILNIIPERPALSPPLSLPPSVIASTSPGLASSFSVTSPKSPPLTMAEGSPVSPDVTSPQSSDPPSPPPTLPASFGSQPPASLPNTFGSKAPSSSPQFPYPPSSLPSSFGSKPPPPGSCGSQASSSQPQQTSSPTQFPYPPSSLPSSFGSEPPPPGSCGSQASSSQTQQASSPTQFPYPPSSLHSSFESKPPPPGSCGSQVSSSQSQQASLPPTFGTPNPPPSLPATFGTPNSPPSLPTSFGSPYPPSSLPASITTQNPPQTLPASFGSPNPSSPTITLSPVFGFQERPAPPLTLPPSFGLHQDSPKTPPSTLPAAFGCQEPTSLAQGSAVPPQSLPSFFGSSSSSSSTPSAEKISSPAALPMQEPVLPQEKTTSPRDALSNTFGSQPPSQPTSRKSPEFRATVFVTPDSLPTVFGSSQPTQQHAQEGRTSAPDTLPTFFGSN